MMEHFLIVLSLSILIYTMFCCFEKQVEAYSSNKDPMLIEIKKRLQPVLKPSDSDRGHLKNLSNKKWIDEISFYKGDKSYTINKKKVYLCLKNESGGYYPINLLMYVTLHEVAHTMCESIGHTEEFKEIFNELLEKASVLGVYDPTQEIDPEYCLYND